MSVAPHSNSRWHPFFTSPQKTRNNSVTTEHRPSDPLCISLPFILPLSFQSLQPDSSTIHVHTQRRKAIGQQLVTNTWFHLSITSRQLKEQQQATPERSISTSNIHDGIDRPGHVPGKVHLGSLLCGGVLCHPRPVLGRHHWHRDPQPQNQHHPLRPQQPALGAASFHHVHRRMFLHLAQPHRHLPYVFLDML